MRSADAETATSKFALSIERFKQLKPGGLVEKTSVPGFCFQKFAKERSLLWATSEVLVPSTRAATHFY